MRRQRLYYHFSFVNAGIGNITTDDFYWTLGSNTSDGILDGDLFPFKFQSADFSAGMVANGAHLDGTSKYLNLGQEPGTCLTQLEFCQTFNLFFFLSFAGTQNGDQYIVSRTTTLSSKSGFYFRFANLDPRLPLRRYFEVPIAQKYDDNIPF